MTTVVVTPPATEPVSLMEANTHLRLDDGHPEEALLEALITAAREHIEAIASRALITQTIEQRMDGLPSCPGVIKLARAPVQAVSDVAFVDSDGNTDTVSDFQSDVQSEPARLAPVFNESWPATQNVLNAVTITYTAGYGDAAGDVPRPLRQAVLLLAAHWFDNRAPVTTGSADPVKVPFMVEALLAPYRLQPGAW